MKVGGVRRVVAAAGLLVCVALLAGAAQAEPVATFSINDVSVNESAGTASFTVTLSADAGVASSVHWATSGGTAQSPDDYADASGDLNFAAGDLSEDVTVTINNDALHEPDEKFAVTLSAPTPAETVAIADGVGEGTILANDEPPPPPPTVSINDAEATEGGEVAFTLTRSSAALNPVTVSYATSDGSAVGADYFGVGSTQVTFDTGQTTKQITVGTKQDTLDENAESFTVTISPVENATIGDGTGTGTINDDADDQPSVATIQDVDVTEESTTANLIVTLSAPSGKTIKINYSLGEGGTATPGADFDTPSGQIEFAPGQTTRSIPVAIKEDTQFEGDETIFVNLSGHENVAPGADLQGKVTIKDDGDAAPAPTVPNASVAEGNSGTNDLVFQVTLPGPRPATTFNYRTVPQSANGSDFIEVGGAQLTFPALAGPGPTTLPITIKVKGDTVDENDESFTLQLLNSTSGAVVASATGTILNDDNNSKLTINDASADEPSTGTATLKFTISLAPASDRAVSVNWATANGTAAAGTDYTAASGSVSFAPGETTKDVTVSVTGDTVNEDNETVLVNLSGAGGAAVSDAQGQGTIIDKNAPPSLSINDVLTREGELVTFTITLAGNTLRTVTVVARTVEGTAKDGTEYHTRRSVLTFAPGEKTKTFQVPGIDDTVSEAIETYFVDLEDAVNATVTKRRGTATIDASDRPQTVTPANTPDVKKPTGPTKTLLPRMVLGPRALTISPTGVARMVLTCAKASPIACTGVVALESTTKTKFQLGRKTFSVQKGKKAFVRIKLSVRTLKLLKKDGLLQAKAVVVVKNSAKKTLRVEPGVVTLKMSKPVATKLLAKLLKPKPKADTQVVVDP
jgi:hypothetical protein